jgi:uncharacterized membrane protein
MRNFNLLSFLLRFVAAAIIVLLTFNPSGYSYYHWLSEAIEKSAFSAEHAFTGVILLIGWTVLVRSAMRSLGAIGLILASVLIGTFVWLIADYGVLDADSETSIIWIALVCLAALLAIGMSWSHVRRRLSGQIDTDDIGD